MIRTPPDAPPPTEGRPAVGNVLGFSMLLSHGEVLLRLGSRALAPGVRLQSYEAVVSGVGLPLSGELSAQTYRQHRCRVRRVSLLVEARALQTWVARRLVDGTYAGLTVHAVTLDLAARLDPSGDATVCLVLEGRVEGAAAWVALPMALRPDGRRIVFAAGAAWVLGSQPLDATALSLAIAKRLAGRAHHDSVGAPAADPLAIVLPRAFVSAGWKVPDVHAVAVSKVAATSQGLGLEFSDDGAPPSPAPPRRPSRVDAAIADVRDAQRSGDPTALLEKLEELSDALAHHDQARAAALRWLAEASREHDPDRCLTALRVWMHLCPNDSAAIRILIALVGRHGNGRELARRLTAACRFPNPPRVQARLELSLANMLIDHVGDRLAARALVDPLAQRLVRGEVDRELATEIWTCVAKAHADHPERARQATQRALSTTDRAAQRASVQFAVGRALRDAGQGEAAEPLLASAAELAPDDPALALRPKPVAVAAPTDDDGRAPASSATPQSDGEATARAPSDPQRSEASDSTSEPAATEPTGPGGARPSAERSENRVAPSEPLNVRTLSVAIPPHEADAEPRAPSVSDDASEDSADPDATGATTPSATGSANDASEPHPLRAADDPDTLDAPDAPPANDPARALAETPSGAGAAGAPQDKADDDPDADSSADADGQPAPAARQSSGPALSVVPEAVRPTPAPSPSDGARKAAWDAFERDGDEEAAATILEDALADRPTDALLLSTLKSIASGQPHRYCDAVERAVAAADDDGERDRWALELAMTAAELDDRSRANAAIERLSPAATDTLEVAALRDWASEPPERHPDADGDASDVDLRGDVEVDPGFDDATRFTEPYADHGAGPDTRVPPPDRAGGELAGDGSDPHVGDGSGGLLGESPNSDDARLDQLEQSLDGPLLASAPADELRELAQSLSPEEATLRSLLELTESIAVGDPRRPPLAAALLVHAGTVGAPWLALAALRQAAECADQQPLLDAWPIMQRIVLARGDDAALAELVAICRSVSALMPEADGLLGTCLVAYPESAQLHATLRHALTDRLAANGERPDPDSADLDAAVLSELDDLTERRSSDAIEAARLLVGATGCMPGPTGAAILAQRAEAMDWRGPSFVVVIDALERAGHWPQVIALHERRAQSETTAPARLDARKRLAYICTEVLGDTVAAVGHLEAALSIAPTDPDLLLPLLDHHFGQRDLSRAVELTARVLDYVRMGHAAYASLAHRAADAAIAMGDPVTAAELLSRVVSRNPDDHKAATRLTELELMAGDPERRIELLGSVADRQTGKARIEALEERARLLLASERPDAAMEDLATVCREAPDRTEASRRLAALYHEHGRHEALVTLYEAELNRRHGADKIPALIEIAGLHARHTGDLGRAEAALRLGLEYAGDDDGPLRAKLDDGLVDNLERQGRYADLAVWLETRLSEQQRADDDPNVPPSPRRLAALSRLAALYRDHLADEDAAATIYRRLEAHEVLPDDGLATLARWYRKERRYDDLVRILTLRAASLAESGNDERRALVERWIAELLEGPLGRPQDAAAHYLEAYLADRDSEDVTGARARVLLSGTDSIANVRRMLLDRLETLAPARHPALLVLLADLLAPHEGYDEEAEDCYRRALEGDPGRATAHEGLGRLLLRMDRASDAARSLIAAVRNEGLAADRAADVAALAARALSEQGRAEQAEGILRVALTRVPDSQRALLELSAVHEKAGRHQAQAEVLEQLAGLPLSGPRKADVAFQRAMLLRDETTRDPRGPAGERARSLLLEAVSADARHAAARQTLVQLAAAREEWSIVAHMHYLTIRELPPGSQRAASHLELAEVYLDRLGDPASCMRNIESALQQASDDIVVTTRTTALARRMPDPRTAAEHFEQVAGGDNDLDEAARSRLWLLAADLRMDDDEPADAAGSDLQALSRRLDNAEPREAVELLSQIPEFGAKSSQPVIAEARQRARTLASDEGVRRDIGVTGQLRELLAARGDYDEAVDLSRVLASSAAKDDPARAARLLTEAAGFAWHALREPVRATGLLAEALVLAPGHEAASASLDELARAHLASADADALREALLTATSQPRPAAVSVAVAVLSRALGDETEAMRELSPVLNSAQPRDVPFVIQWSALSLAERLFAARGDRPRRREVLTRSLRLGLQHDPTRVGDVAAELARLHRELGDSAAATQTCQEALAHNPDHRGVLQMYAELLERSAEWAKLVETQTHLAQVALADDEQALWLTRAAQAMLAHPEAAPDRTAARRLLVRACAVAPNRALPRATLLPLSFSQMRWRETLDLADELRSIPEARGEPDDFFVLAALAEAYHTGSRDLASRMGPPTDHRIDEWLLPGLRRVLDEVATRGPLPRLDDVLSAAVRICGGRITLFDSMTRWALQRPVNAGVALALGRLSEADGDASRARHQFQLAAFLAPDGAVPGLVARLPAITAAPVEDTELTGGSSVRTLLVALRASMVGLPWAEAFTPIVPRPEDRPLLEQVEMVLEPARHALSLSLPVTWVQGGPTRGVCAQARAPVPGIVISPAIAQLPWAERAFRLASAAVDVAMGLAVVAPPGPDLTFVLEALEQHVAPGHEARRDDARTIAEALRIGGAPRDLLGALERVRLLDELAHHRRHPIALSSEIARRRDVLATMLSGRLDGALLAFARDTGRLSARKGERSAVVASERVQWLLRALMLR